MKISYNWLKEYIDIDLDPEQISGILTNTGLEVEKYEKIETIKGGLAGVVIGEVKTCIKHPGADKLSVTTVDVGSGTILPIVCGAPNVAAGQKVVVATVGTTLYSAGNPFEIKKAKIRGEVSEGMICAEDELGLGDSHAGIIVLPADAEVGTPAKDYFNIEDDYVFEIGLTPNRTDAMSHIGVARDLIASINLQNPQNPVSLIKPCVDSFKVDNNSRPFEIIIEDTGACPRYSGLTITGVEVKDSPDWLKNRLLAIGLRPINNLVDISNFILHETGHPTHFFDADKVAGDKVIIKKLPKGTRFITLDEVERELSGEDLMICNASEGMCIGGVFGGLHSGVTAETKNVFLESAYFDPKTLRKTSRFHGLNTDSSFRFERGADPNITTYALKRAAMLIQQLAGGTVASDIVDVYPKPITNWQVKLSYQNISRLIGKNIGHNKIKDILIWLGMEIIEDDENGLTVEVPTFKGDVRREADVIEEILRIYGYNNIEFPAELRSSLSYISKPDAEFLQNLVSDYLTGNGFYETMNNSLTKSAYAEKHNVTKTENDVKIMNALSSDLNVLRQNLLFSGLETILYNSNRKNQDLKIYEFGKVYHQDASKAKPNDSLAKFGEEMHLAIFITGKINNESWYQPQREADIFYLKQFVMNIFKKLGLNPASLLQSEIKNEVFEIGLKFESGNKKLIELGKLNQKLVKAFDIKQDVFYADFNWAIVLQMVKNHKVLYHEVSKYPGVRRDLALLVNQEVKFDDLKKAAFETEKYILKEVSLFDVYEGEKIEKGKKSYALSFILQDEKRTLTDKIIDKTMQKLVEVYTNKFKVVLR